MAKVISLHMQICFTNFCFTLFPDVDAIFRLTEKTPLMFDKPAGKHTIVSILP